MIQALQELQVQLDQLGRWDQLDLPVLKVHLETKDCQEIKGLLVLLEILVHQELLDLEEILELLEHQEHQDHQDPLEFRDPRDQQGQVEHLDHLGLQELKEQLVL